MPDKPKCRAVEKIANSRLFCIEQVDLKFSNGEERLFERVVPARESAGSVLVIPMLDHREFLLIKEYATGVDEYVLGFPKGLVDVGEDALLAANRELQEEVGYRAGRLTHLGMVSTSPSYMSSRIDIVLAQDLEPSKLEGDEPEPLQVMSGSLDRLNELFEDPSFQDARCMAALWRLSQVAHA